MLASTLASGVAELRASCVPAAARPCCRAAPSCNAAQPDRQSQPAAAVRLGRQQLQRAAVVAGSLSYKDAGVDIDAGNELVNRIKKLNPAIGGFAGTYPFGDGKLLVAGTDGVGTKLKLAFEMNKHDTIGIDLVAMSVNDILCQGAKPMFFLDYFATSSLDVDNAEMVVKGIVEGCKQSDCILMGGETAEMPDMYKKGEYDLAGFAVGSVDEDRLIDGKSVAAGDLVLGLASSGVHSNGFSLVHKILQVSGTKLGDKVPWGEATFGEVLLEPTVIYVRRIMKVLQLTDNVKGLVHITGGGFWENIPRVLPEGLQAKIFRDKWEVPPLFQWLQKEGGVTDNEMFRTYNMGVGMIMVVPPGDVHTVLGAGIDAFVLGEIVEGQGVQLV
mmetsp:Transcript_18686/g.56491  ORF Transcript_18686/g.56491 Transcript_18686/m.56491 type:complete len:386 (+) Transcript_18686:167-1324(+)|eukprot:CAMPEP_0206141806 /NCGR_PEP_ID=MMETSP1473-20131121/14215_1 /ASSEMBLY_ACC=CAM_ASM_001109 /TAXON_ID=1461547 /ORGANISM="Stichococcus sp, Strain RCC1054" /LENGTH=385 /DNA_ID=CAMNT_0053536513 /DNA_START=111 /DNA_END=1268 /DNA_ORIENTATION=-